MARSLLKIREECNVTNTEKLLKELGNGDGILAALEACGPVPNRREKEKDYKITERNKIDGNKIEKMRKNASRNCERILEANLFEQWRAKPCDPIWSRLLSWQIPLFAEQGKGGWGYIDLLGISKRRRPVVVEVKQENNHSDTPLAATLEALAYAWALSKRWVSIIEELPQEERAMLSKFTVKDMGDIEMVVLAPLKYWNHWNKPQGRFFDQREAVSSLLGNLQRQGWQISLCCLDNQANPKEIRKQQLLP